MTSLISDLSVATDMSSARSGVAEPEPRQLAIALLERLAAAHAFAVRQTALRCAKGDRLDSLLLDTHQWVCYELAWSSADLLAAKTVVAATAAGSKIDSDLALAFAAEAIASVLGRLMGIFSDIGHEAHDLRALAAGPEVARLRKHAAGATAMAELGRAVAASNGQWAQVDLDDSTAIASQAFSRFAADVIAPMAEEIHRRDLTLPEALLRPLREMGVFGLSIPTEYGGTAARDSDNTLMMIAVTEALSEASLAAGGSLITRSEILTRALMTGGTEEQRRHWLPRIATGDPLCAISITEPDFGSNVAGLSLKATRVPGGWHLDGAKTWCTLAGKAGVLMVVARTDSARSSGHSGLSVMLVEKPSYEGHAFTYVQPDGGKLTGRSIPTIGYRGMHSFDLSFERLFVPDSNVIGGEAGVGKGFYLTMVGMVGGRIQTAGRALGVMRAAIKAALQYAKDRKVFDAPLVDYQLTQVKLAWMASRYAACRQLAYAVGRRLDSDQGRIESSLAKLFACRSAEVVTREAQQIHGGMGYAEEVAVSRYFVDARVLSIFEGAEETLALKVIAKGLLEQALRLRDS